MKSKERRLSDMKTGIAEVTTAQAVALQTRAAAITNNSVPESPHEAGRRRLAGRDRRHAAG